MNTKVDEFLAKSKKWQQELEQLRNIILECGLMESFKWGVPCYMFQESNIVLIHGFKDYCAILFVKGALLSDDQGILIQQTENTQSARQIRFKNLIEILRIESVIKSYIYEAIEIEKVGLKVTFKKSSELIYPEEFQTILKKNLTLKTAFESLTPGRQSGYIIFFAAAKQSKTRESRIENSIERILKGKGLNDCVCGLSKRMPNCDGSHKFLKAT